MALGGTVTVPSGDYAPLAILQSDITVQCAPGATCTVDASNSLTGITIGDPLYHSFEVFRCLAQSRDQKIYLQFLNLIV